MIGNKLGSSVNWSSKNLVEIELPKMNVKIKYDPKSELEHNWLLQIDGTPGLKNINRSNLKLQYSNTLHQVVNYYPDFEVEWDTGLKWLVEIKGILTDDDYNKMSGIREWAIENGYQYRLITTGLVKTNTWSTVFSHPKNIPIPSIEYVMMNHAASWRALSTSPRLQVGAIICSQDLLNIVSYGYNGDEKGGANCPTNSLPGQDGFIHAEENALLKLKTKEPVIMFITDSPCLNCAKRIINSGNVKEVYYLKKYRDMSGVGLLSSNGIKTYHFQLIDYKGRHFSDEEALEILTPAGLKFD
jgi:dCMP deaminase